MAHPDERSFSESDFAKIAVQFPSRWTDNVDLTWLEVESLRVQLPRLLQLWGRLQTKLGPHPWLNHHLFRTLLGALSRIGPKEFQICLDPAIGPVYLDATDPLFLHWIQYLKTPDRDSLWLASFLEEGDTFIDVGANIGIFSRDASHRLGKRGQVITFEPQSHARSLLQKNLASLPNLLSYSFALGERQGEAALYIPEGNKTAASLYREVAKISRSPDRFTLETVRIETLDCISKEWKVSGKAVLKIDVEGNEWRVLNGAVEFIDRVQPLIYLEQHPRTIQWGQVRPKEVEKFLRYLGYTVFLKKGQPVLQPIEELRFREFSNVLLMIPEKHSQLQT